MVYNILENLGSIIMLNAQMMLLFMFIVMLMVVFYYILRIAVITTKWVDFEEWVKKENKEVRENERND